MRALRPALLLIGLISVMTGCRSHVISARLVNDSSQPVSMIIVDYPGATFGVNSLAPGKSFLYRFKSLDTGALKIQFTNAEGVVHNVTGPTVQKNQEGSVEIKFTQDSATIAMPAR
jgi:hypothetical protein